MAAEKEVRVRSKIKSYLKRKGYDVWIEPQVVTTDRTLICKPDVFGVKGEVVLKGWWWEIKAFEVPVGKGTVQDIVKKINKIKRRKDVIFLSDKGKELRHGELTELKVTLVCGEGGFVPLAESLARKYGIETKDPSKLKARKRKRDSGLWSLFG